MVFYNVDTSCFVDTYSMSGCKRISPVRVRASSSRYQPYCAYNTSTCPSTEYPQINNTMVTGMYDLNSYVMTPYDSVPMTIARWKGTGETNSRVANSFAYQDVAAAQTFDLQQHLHALRSLQESTGYDAYVQTGTVSKEGDHPFYWRRRSPPAEGITRTRDKYRVVYTEKQRLGLEKEYENNKFITTQKKTELAKDLALSDRQVTYKASPSICYKMYETKSFSLFLSKDKYSQLTIVFLTNIIKQSTKCLPFFQIKIWFQNRRAKERRDNRKSSDPDTCSPPYSEETRTETTSSAVTSQFTSCRFAGNETSPTSNFNTGQCLHQPCSTENQAGDLKSLDNEIGSRFGLPISPSEWNTSLSNDFVPQFNVSPLTVNMDFRFGQRL